MKIKKMLSQHRRDFRAIYECDHCGNTEELSGYDDSYFHNEVIPAMECGNCKKTTPESYVANKTKYPEGMQL